MPDHIWNLNIICNFVAIFKTFCSEGIWKAKWSHFLFLFADFSKKQNEFILNITRSKVILKRFSFWFAKFNFITLFSILCKMNHLICWYICLIEA